MAYRLDTCVWELTLACAYSCAHCGSRAGSAREGELSSEEALDVARQLAEMGCRRVVLIGGEVFLRDDWDSVARVLSDAGVEASIITNGSCLDEDVWQRLNRAGVGYIAVSVDGARRSHDLMRMPGSFAVAMDALAQAKKRGLTTAAITVLNADNVADLGELHGELASRDVDAWQLQLCSPFGNAAHSHGLVPSPEQIREVVRFATDLAKGTRAGGGGPLIFVADNIGYHTPEEGLLRGRPGVRFSGCMAGIHVVGIDSVGNVRGCESLYDDRFIEGNLRERCLADIWSDPSSFSYNRKLTLDSLGGKCGTCSIAFRCAAGCRSLNYFLTGDPFMSATCIREC